MRETKCQLFKAYLKVMRSLDYRQIEQFAKDNFIKTDTLARKLRQWRADGEIKCLNKKGKVANGVNEIIYTYKII